MGIQFMAINTNKMYTNPSGLEFPSRIEMGEEWEFFSMTATNAQSLFGLLGIKFDECGEVSIPDARRAVMKATATFETRASNFVRDTVVEHGKPRTDENGVVELRPVRMMSFGIDEDYLSNRLEQFSGFVEEAARNGATHVSWG